jgi:hypothetical protein
MRRRRGPWVVLGLAGVLAASAVGPGPLAPAASEEPGAGVDRQAVDALRRMSDYLTSLPEFTVRARHVGEVVLTTGQKIQFEGISDLFVRRPDRLRSNRVDEVADLEFYYDGATATLYGKRSGFYASAPAPPTLDAMLDHVRARLDMEPPAADLLYTDVFTGLMTDVTEALDLGSSMVGRMPTRHLAFRARDVDWQIWIDDGARPLPRKYLITTKWRTGAPQFGVELGDWNLFPRLDDATFKFSPPARARRIEFLPPGASPR